MAATVIIIEISNYMYFFFILQLPTLQCFHCTHSHTFKHTAKPTPQPSTTPPSTTSASWKILTQIQSHSLFLLSTEIENYPYGKRMNSTKWKQNCNWEAGRVGIYNDCFLEKKNSNWVSDFQCMARFFILGIRWLEILDSAILEQFLESDYSWVAGRTRSGVMMMCWCDWCLWWWWRRGAMEMARVIVATTINVTSDGVYGGGMDWGGRGICI